VTQPPDPLEVSWIDGRAGWVLLQLKRPIAVMRTYLGWYGDRWESNTMNAWNDRYQGQPEYPPRPISAVFSGGLARSRLCTQTYHDSQEAAKECLHCPRPAHISPANATNDLNVPSSWKVLYTRIWWY